MSGVWLFAVLPKGLANNFPNYFLLFHNRSKHHRTRIQCEHCSAVVYSHYMKKHMQKHLTVRPYQCTLCDKSFTTLSQLKSHEFRHTNERPLACTECTKMFKLACDLRIHMLSHTDERKYPCDRCEKSFRMRSHLADHLETHRTVNTIPCPLCMQLFKTSVTLRSHIKQVHAKNYAFKCEHCDRGFSRRHKLMRHMGTHEKREQRKLRDEEQKRAELEQKQKGRQARRNV